MTKEDYLSRKRILDKQFAQYAKDVEELNAIYLQEHALPLNKKVVIIKTNGQKIPAYVFHRRVDFASWEAREGIVYSFKKLRIDGSESLVNIHCWTDEKFALL